MKITRIILLSILSFLCISCSKELVLEGGWDMMENNPISLNFGEKGGSTTLTSLNFKSWEIVGVQGAPKSNISAEVVEDNRIEIKLSENKNTAVYKIYVVSPEKPDLVGEVIINQNIKK